MDIRIIKAPTSSVLEIISKRSNLKFEGERPGAIGLVQGKIIEMICAADIAEKCVGVRVSDVRGSCPQNFVLIAIVGEISEVIEALDMIKKKNGEKDIWL